MRRWKGKTKTSIEPCNNEDNVCLKVVKKIYEIYVFKVSCERFKM